MDDPHRGLRAAGFLLVAVGALMAGVGALTAWVEVGLAGSTVDAISPVELGVDRPEGIAALALAAAALVAALVSRIGRSGARRRTAVIAALVGLAIVAICAGTVALGTTRFEEAAIERIRALPDDRRPPDELIPGIAELTQARFRSGLWLSLAGGVVVMVGGLTTIAWTNRVRASSPQPTP